MFFDRLIERNKKKERKKKKLSDLVLTERCRTHIKTDNLASSLFFSPIGSQGE